MLRQTLPNDQWRWCGRRNSTLTYDQRRRWWRWSYLPFLDDNRRWYWRRWWLQIPNSDVLFMRHRGCLSHDTNWIMIFIYMIWWCISWIVKIGYIARPMIYWVGASVINGFLYKLRILFKAICSLKKNSLDKEKRNREMSCIYELYLSHVFKYLYLFKLEYLALAILLKELWKSNSQLFSAIFLRWNNICVI